MPSKKKLRKQNQRLKRDNRGWQDHVDVLNRELGQLRTAARELVHALDNGRQDDIPTRKDAVRDLLPGEPWTLERIMRLKSTMSAVAAAMEQPIDRDIIMRDGRDWTDTLPDEAPRLAEAVKKAREQGRSWGSWTVTDDGQFTPIVDPYNGGRPVVSTTKPDETNTILRNNEAPLDSGGQTHDMGPRPQISRGDAA